MKKLILMGLLFVGYLVLAPLFFSIGMDISMSGGSWFNAFVAYFAAYLWAWNAKVQFDRMKHYWKEFWNGRYGK